VAAVAMALGPILAEGFNCSKPVGMLGVQVRPFPGLSILLLLVFFDLVALCLGGTGRSHTRMGEREVLCLG
jgi:hypothetical protein